VDPIAVLDIQGIIRQLKARGIGIMLTDHNVRETLSITDRAYILYEGKILLTGTAKKLAGSKKAREIYLGEKFTL
jgi:lipopolysaccharide export system ATP-binding protein